MSAMNTMIIRLPSVWLTAVVTVVDLAKQLVDINGSGVFQKHSYFMRLLNKQTDNKYANALATYIGDFSHYDLKYLNTNPKSNEYHLTESGTLVDFFKIYNKFMREPTDAGAIMNAFNQYSDRGKNKLFYSLYTWLINHDARFAALHAPKKPKPAPRVISSKKEPLAKVAKPKKPKISKQQRIKNEVEKQQLHLQQNRPEKLSTLAKMYLDTTPGKTHLDQSFHDHPLVMGWKPSFQVTQSINHSHYRTPLGNLRGYVLDDPQVGFLPWMKRQLSAQGVLTPHALELAFDSKKGLQRVPRAVQVEAAMLIMQFSNEYDYVGLANVLHGRYAGEYALRRKKGWESLSVTGIKDGLIDKLMTGDFDHEIKSIYVEAAFWYYLSVWAYKKAQQSQREGSAYLKPDESSFSVETQRIISEIRKQTFSSGGSKVAESELSRLKQQNRILQEQMQSLRGLTVASLATIIRQYNEANSGGKNVLDDDGKLNQYSQDRIKEFLTRDPIMSQYMRLIQQSVPEFTKISSEYENDERGRKR